MHTALATPILFLVFNRPDETRQVFERIRQQQPQWLFVAADGPRENFPLDEQLCQQTRQLVLGNIDWPCRVETLLRPANLGCGQAVSQALTWFFDRVEMGIVLEDDTLPSPSFFSFCETCLNLYKNDSRVMMVSGFNHLGQWSNGGNDIFFSQLGSIWGWASWRRAWQLNRENHNDWQWVKQNGVINKIMPTSKMAHHRINVVQRTFNNEIDTWDYYWSFYRLINNGLTAMPVVNLVTNIGFGNDATHTRTISDSLSSLTAHEYPANHTLVVPTFVFQDNQYDKQVFYRFIHSPLKNSLPAWLRKFLRKKLLAVGL